MVLKPQNHLNIYINTDIKDQNIYNYLYKIYVIMVKILSNKYILKIHQEIGLSRLVIELLSCLWSNLCLCFSLAKKNYGYSKGYIKMSPLHLVCIAEQRNTSLTWHRGYRNLRTVSNSKQSTMIGCLRTRFCKQPIIVLYIELENEVEFYNLEA